jgi:hypothetical protein
MKLAEALLLRADIKKKLAGLRLRVTSNAVVQDGEKPHEDPSKLIKETLAVIDEHEKLVIRINEANHKHKVPDGRTLAQVIESRQKMMMRHSLITAAIEASRKEPDRFSPREIKWVSLLDVPKLQNQISDLAKQIRELNALIQKTNWSVEID